MANGFAPMNAALRIRRKRLLLAQRYEVAMRRYLEQGPAASLRPALHLGGQALALGMETLDLALIHEQAFIGQLLSAGSAAGRDRIITRARAFFAEAILPMEQTHRSALESNANLSRLNEALSRRTMNLAASSQLLRKQISRRQAVEETLRKSEEHTRLLLEESRHLQQQLQMLSRRVLLTQEEERKRISRELHDVIAQMLTGINVQLATLKIGASQHTLGLTRKIACTQRLVERSVDIVHRFARDLRPAVLDDLGLIPALHALAKGFAKETGTKVRLTAFAGVEALSSAKRTALYRVAQEALGNVARHAQARRVDMTIQGVGKGVQMLIKDDGVAFDVERIRHVRKNQRLGLLGMRERVEMVGGRFSIESARGHGTTLQVEIPFGNGG